ncbi:hypothetical protein GRI40_06055 [Altererythrobacter aerius]|uniref:Uncharacterized protein n=1 Tax=Tsuneonella aeria TaxID=1837929 RepID=A0A6I4TCJ3_9SPHN|nr:hypothetical protein [Tsuneonella aeria]MXO74783.1 hypothetical protein [Tsuneonella aeria]
MIILRTAGEVDTFLATPLGRETEGIIRPHLERLADYEFEDIAAIAICEGRETPASLGLDPYAFEFQDDHPVVGFREQVFVTDQSGCGWIILSRL